MTHGSPKALFGLVAMLAFAGSARANPRPLPFTYQHEQIAEGSSELEQFVDITPTRARSTTSGDPVWFGLTQFQTEFEHGITSRLELGLYVSFVPGPPSDVTDLGRAMEGNGVKQRLRYQLAPTGEWPIDVGLYGELAETEREIEIEGKIILQRRLGLARIIANAQAEQEFYYNGNRDFVIRPSAAATFELSPAIQPGVEWWMHAEFPEKDPPSARPFGLGPHHYVGPALLLQFGNLWWTTGVYYRVSDMMHTLQPAEGFGNLWIRTVVGIGI